MMNMIRMSITQVLNKVFHLPKNNFQLQRWNDDLLYWNPARFGGLRQISLPKDAVWLPVSFYPTSYYFY